MSAAAKMDTSVTKLAMVEFFMVKFIMFAALFFGPEPRYCKQARFLFCKSEHPHAAGAFFPCLDALAR